MVDPLSTAIAGAAGHVAGKVIEGLTEEAKKDLESGLTGAGRRLWMFLRGGKRAAVPREPSEFESIRQIWKDSEMDAYRAILKTDYQLRLAADGIVLRRLQDRPTALEGHRKNIHRYGGPEGLRFAQAVQMGVLKFLMEHLERADFVEEYRVNQVRTFFQNITRHVRFVESSEDEDRVYHDVDNLLSTRPVIFFIAGAGDAGTTARNVGQRAYEEYLCYSHGCITDRGRVIVKLCLEPDGWVPPEVEEKRRNKTVKTPVKVRPVLRGGPKGRTPN